MNRIQQSEALHYRVTRFAVDALEGRSSGESFDDLAREIAVFQNPAQPAPSPTVVDVFRAGHVFAFEPEQAVACFETSGTTSVESGRHYFRTTRTYAHLSVAWGRRALVDSRRPPPHVVALMPNPTACPSSSLVFMCERFMQAFDPNPPGAKSVSPWLLSADGVSIAALRHHIELASVADRPLLLLATSFSLVMLLDALGNEQVPLPPGSVVMQTGGFKGRTREVPAAELTAQLEASLAPHAIVGEYGMTELSSQLYEGTLPGGALDSARGVYVPPPWMRALVLDPATLQPLPDGATGLAAFVDLANVDSALFVVTQDMAQAENGGLRLLGRRPRAPLRGCSLAAEAVWTRQLARRQAGPVLSKRAARAGVHRGSEDLRAMDRVRRLIDAARRIAEPRDPLGQRARTRLLETTGLSLPSIELGLSTSLEVSPTDQELSELCASVPRSNRTWVVLSANVFVAAHRAIACALASSSEVAVRRSRRDPVLAELLCEAAPGLFKLVDELDPAPGDHVHAYGSDETMLQLEQSLPHGVTLLAHGSGLGAGMLLERGMERTAAKGFAADAVVFEQRGCLSPRIIGVSSQCNEKAFAAELVDQLNDWAKRVPAPSPSGDTLAELSWYDCLARRLGELQSSAHGSVLLLRNPARLVIPPEGRNLVVFTSENPLEQLRPLASLVTCVGAAVAEPDAARIRHALPHARFAIPGQMQSPPFDGPVDLRVRG